jgi:hypothetical protein
MSDNTNTEALTAFLVVMPVDGVAYAVDTIPGDVPILRKATQADMRRACQDVVHDLNAQAASQYVVAALNSAEEPSTVNKLRAALASRAQDAHLDHDNED